MAEAKIGDDVVKECLCTAKCGADCKAPADPVNQTIKAPKLEA